MIWHISSKLEVALTLSDKAGKERYVIQFLPPLGVHIHFVQVFVQFSW